MNLSISKSFDKIAVDLNEYNEDPNIMMNFLTTSGGSVDPFSFISIVFYGKEYKESVSITVGKDALEKFVVLMEEVIKGYREKNTVSVAS